MIKRGIQLSIGEMPEPAPVTNNSGRCAGVNADVQLKLKQRVRRESSVGGTHAQRAIFHSHGHGLSTLHRAREFPRCYLSSNSKVLTTRIFFTGVLVGLYGPDSSLPSLPKIWIDP